MVLAIKYYSGGAEVTEKVECGSREQEAFNSKAKGLSDRFNVNYYPDAVILEQRKYDNGNESVAIKDRNRKIIVQYCLTK